MPRVDPMEFFTDRTKYPDDMEITLANGDTISVKEYRDKALPKADFTRATEGWSQKERQYQEGLNAANENLRRALEEKQALEARPAAAPAAPAARAGDISEEELERDPVLGPLYRKQQAALARVEAHESQLKTLQTTLEGHAATYTRNRFLGTIAELKKKDPDLNVDEFLAYTQKRPVVDVASQQVDLDETYKVYRHDHLVDSARKAGEEAGVEKGKAAARVPAVPFGRRRAPVRPEGLPETFQQLDEDKVAADPEMQAAMRGEEE